MMNNVKKMPIPSKIYNGNDPKAVREFLSKIGIEIPEDANIAIASPVAPEVKSEEVSEQPKYVPDKPAVTFDNVTLYAYDENAEGTNEIRSCFCDIADKYNASFMNIPEDIRYSIFDSVTAAGDNTNTIIRAIVSSFIQATSNLVWSLAKSVNDLAANYGVKPFEVDNYDLNTDSVKYSMMSIIRDVFNNDSKKVEDLVNSGMLHYMMATEINTFGNAVHNTFACNIIPRMIPYMTAKDAENFYKGFNLLFRMFMGDLNYEGCVLENTLLADENPAVIMDNLKISENAYKQHRESKYFDEIEG